ncbi:hypothetical protein BGZ65_002082 [Modicella reniformis]|uniref:Uncharacterized protein n=1 Tax=Modicella reniformis TaxID=1440133 RepID=A0A9P6M0L2_9FUNG|nr:hypothetical protein BGZ65_002082 [Modicella reniformis]
MATTASILHQSTPKDSFASSDLNAYPSPSLSPATPFLVNVQQEQRSPSPATFHRPRPSVKALLSSANPPVSPLDALVMALEATVEEEEEEGRFGQDRTSPDEGTAAEDDKQEEDEEDDPDATIPSSPTITLFASLANDDVA